MRTDAFLSAAPDTILGHRKDGRPIHPIAGGSETVTEPVITIPAPVTPPPAPEPSSERTFTAADLEKARKEEKDKLYGKLQGTEDHLKTLQEEVARLQGERETREAAEKKAREEAEAEAKQKFEEESSAKELIAKQREEFEARLAAIEAERQQERALHEKEREFNQLQSYITKRAAEELNNTIAPELIDLIIGNTPDEVEASIATLQAKTQAIVESMRQAQLDARAQTRGVSTAGYATTGPLDNNSGQLKFTAEELRDMSMVEYAKYRSALLGSASQNQNQRGLFG